MSRLRAHNLSISLDGFMAGPDQSLERPLGVGGPRLHEWVFATRTGAEMIGTGGGETGIDDDFLKARTIGVGATIMGRNMYGPIRGGWDEPDEGTGWWGPSPPYHHPVFVLTHHAHDPIVMEGGTTFHFVTDGIESAWAQASAAAGDDDVILGGGASTVRQYLRAGLLDDLHLAVVPVLLGTGERLLDGLDGALDDFACEVTPSAAVVHYRFTRA